MIMDAENILCGHYSVFTTCISKDSKIFQIRIPRPHFI